ncbi:MAG TPA: electron transporter SenC [Bacteroidetes bacterium]|nr:electron transporter SenC [Bacteroidota bacterium]
MKTIQRCLAFALLLVLVSCTTREDGQNKQTDLVTFALKGEVVSLDPSARRMTIAHEEIPNYMKAMIMPFKVKDSTLFVGVEVGDSVQGTLAVSRTESWIENLAVIGKGEAPPLSAGDVVFKRLFKEGRPMPEFTFTNQDGKRIKFSDFKGKVLAFTFVYTRCPLPDFCIRMSDHFAKVQKALAKERSLQSSWYLLTISFDPEFDTPAVLKKYGQTYGADFSTWDFATGDSASIRRLADGLDLTLQNDEGGLIAHNLRTVLLDPKGNLSKIFKGNEWSPEDVLAEIRKLSKSNITHQ